MARKNEINCHIKNSTGNILSLTDSSVEDYYETVLPTQISNESTVSIQAKADKAIHDCSMSVTYQAYDDTQFCIKVNDPNAGTNTSSITCVRGNCQNFTYLQTNSTYSEPAQIDSKGNHPTVYFMISKRNTWQPP